MLYVLIILLSSTGARYLLGEQEDIIKVIPYSEDTELNNSVFLAIPNIEGENNPIDLRGTNFKSYDELKTRLDMVLAGTTVVGNVADKLANNPFAEPEETVTVDTKEEPAPSIEVTDDEEKDTLSYFEKLAEAE